MSLSSSEWLFRRRRELFLAGRCRQKAERVALTSRLWKVWVTQLCGAARGTCQDKKTVRTLRSSRL